MAGNRAEDIRDGALRDYKINSEGTFLKAVTKFDDVSGADTSIQSSHHEIHEGNHYFVENFETLGSGAEINISMITGSPKQAHILFNVQASGQTEVYSYEMGSWGTNGTTLVPLNNNRSSANTSQMTMLKDVNVADWGTTLNSKSFGWADTPSKINGGEIIAENEIILGTAGTYLYRIKSQTDSNVVSYHGNWYEHLQTV